MQAHYGAHVIPDFRLCDFVISTADENHIPLKFSIMRSGATDGSVVHIHRDDYDRALGLMVKLIVRLDESTVRGFRVSANRRG